MDTGCPSPLMLLPLPLLRRKRACLARTLEITSHLGIRVESAVAALTNVAGVIVLPKIARSQGTTAVARNLALDALRLPNEIDTLETLHPGGEISTHDYSHLDLFCEAFYFFSVDFRQKDVRMNCILPTFLLGSVALPCFFRRCCAQVL